MKTRTDQETSDKNFIGILKGAVAFILVTLSLFHVFFEAKSSLVPANDDKYDEIVDNRKILTQKYREGLENRSIGIDEFLLKTTELLNSSKAQIDKLNKEKRQINQDHSFRGRGSFHFWIFVFGIVTALFFFACKSLHDDISRGSTFKFQLVSLSGILISSFWYIHLIFFTQKDFQKNNYIALIVFCASLFSVFIYFLVRYYTYKDNIIYKQLSFIERVRAVHYPNIAFKAKYAEQSKSLSKDKIIQGVEKDIEEFQEDYREVVADI